MLERVYRQIKTVNPDVNITIATSKDQVASIYNQLSDKVNICAEPARRDTFPAIALACMYLYDVKNIDINETIVVCLIDPYVDIDYFETNISTDVRYADKSWGNFKLIDADSASRTSKITIAPGKRMSYHSHKYRDEAWTVKSGTGRVIINGKEQRVEAGDIIKVKAGCPHTIIANSYMQIIEVQFGKDISRDDKEEQRLDGMV